MLVRNLLEKYPCRAFHMMTPGGFVDLTPEQAKELLRGEGVKAHPGNPEYGVEMEAKELLSQKVENVRWENGTCYMMTGYQTAQEEQGEELEETIENEKMLKERMKADYEAYTEQLRQKPVEELIEMASEIAAVKFIYEELTVGGVFGEYSGYLLQFENPLEVIRDSWQEYEGFRHRDKELEQVLWSMKDMGTGIGDYPMAEQTGENTQSQEVVMC